MKKTALASCTLLLLLASMFQFCNLTTANPYHRIPVWIDVPPPEGTQEPIISIRTPQNGSFHPKNVTLTVDVIILKTNASYGISELYYKGSWDPNEITVITKSFGDNTSYSIDLSDVRGGNLSITVYAVGVGYIETRSEVVDSIYLYTYYDRFEMASDSTVSFTKDLVPPRISVLSPQNTTYMAPDVKLDFKCSEDVSQILYCIDGKENRTVTGRLAFTGLARGEHSLILYASNLAGNAVASKTLFFSVNYAEPFPFVLVAVILFVVLCAGLLVCFMKRQRSKSP